MPSSLEPKQKHIFIPLLVAIASAIGLMAGYKMNFSNQDLRLVDIDKGQETEATKSGRVEEILRFVETNYVDTIPHDEVVVDAINHILKQLDPHSNYITPEEVDEHNEKMDGEYLGIGIETIKLRDSFYIAGIREEGPAYRAGLRVGDAIITINDSLISGNRTSYNVMRKMLKKTNDESLQLKILSPEKLNKDLSIVPEKISIPSANQMLMIRDDIAYIKIERFNANTYEQFMQSIESVADNQNSELNLIIDLRDNPGGYLPEAINILSQLFQEKDRLMTYTQGLNRKKREYKTTGKQFFAIGKIAVLINGGSASGSEILAGSIQDWDRGIIVGEPSYGKGLVQEVFPLNNGGALRLTVAKYYSPSGRLIQKSYDNISSDFEADTTLYTTRILNRSVAGGGGIEPDIYVEDLYNDYCFNYFDYIDYYLVDRMHDKNSYTLSDTDFAESNLIAFINREYEEQVDSLRVRCELDATQFIEAFYRRMYGSEKEFLEKVVQGDPYVEKAIDVIEDKKTTLALLSDKN